MPIDELARQRLDQLEAQQGDLEHDVREDIKALRDAVTKVLWVLVGFAFSVAGSAITFALAAAGKLK